MRRVEQVALVVSAGILSCQLFFPPAVGLANNGDFGKILAIFSLGAPVEDEYRYAPLKYTFDRRYHYESGFHSSEMLLVAPAVGLHRLFLKNTSFDLRLLGAIHAALFLLAFYRLLPVTRALPPVREAILLGTIVFVFCDVMYASFLNSFYMDTAALLFLLLATVSLLRLVQSRRPADGIWFLASCALMISSKTQHSILAVPVAALLAWKATSLLPDRRLFAGAGVVAMVTAGIISWFGAPRDYARKGYYTVIFTRILPLSSDPANDLQDLRLDESYVRYIGSHAYSRESPIDDPEFARSFTRRASYARLAWFFLRHPEHAYRTICAALGDGGRQRPTLGNFDRSTGLPPFTESNAFSWWSNLKKAFFFEKGARYLLYFGLLAVGFCGLLVARRRSLPEGLVGWGFMLAAMATIVMLVAALADAVDMTRHFSLFNAMTDVIFVSTVSLLISWPRPVH